jgi:CelD/BcsL family acetyltransferase involved in cellulose biosynthesis
VLRTEIITGPDWAEKLERPWQELVSQSDSSTPFQSWEWQSIWWKHYAKKRRPNIFCLYEGDDLVGLMPMMTSRGAWSTLRAMTSGASDYLHPIARTGYETLLAEQLAEYATGLEEVDLVDLHQIRENQPISGLLQPQKVVHQATCLVLDLPDTFDAYLATLNKSLRYDVRKLDKELFTSGKARIQEIELDQVQEGLDAFFETHKKRWRKRGLPGAFMGRAERFHREWAEVARQRGWLWLSLLHHEDKIVGTIYAMRFGNACYYYQAGFDPEASAISPGSLLVGYTIRKAINEGLKTFDFLRGDEPYKRRWKPQHEYRNLRYITPAKGLLGKIGQAWNDAGSRVEHKVRARLEGRGLF